MSAMRQTVQKLKNAKKHLVPKLEVNGVIYEFDQKLFDLSHFNLTELNEQVSNVPAQMAWVGQVLAKADEYVKKIQMEFKIWKVEKMMAFADEKTEGAKENKVMVNHVGEWRKQSKIIREAEMDMRILKAFREGLEAKKELSQTISANNRAERSAFASGGSL